MTKKLQPEKVLRLSWKVFHLLVLFLGKMNTKNTFRFFEFYNGVFLVCSNRIWNGGIIILASVWAQVFSSFLLKESEIMCHGFEKLYKAPFQQRWSTTNASHSAFFPSLLDFTYRFFQFSALVKYHFSCENEYILSVTVNIEQLVGT